jgi:hypothetical protein
VEGVYRLRGRGTLGEPAAPEGVLEEGWVPGPYGPIRASYRILGDRAVVAGDTMVPLDELRELQAQVASGALAPFIGAPVVVPQAAITKKGWPEGRIPYEIADGFEETQLEAIHRAIEHWNERTVIRLAPRSGESTYLRFVQTDKPHCYGYLGYGSGVREIQLSSGCGRGAIIHEIGHVVGLSHEQQRDDRDTYVFFDEDAVDPDYAYAFDYKGRVFGPYNYRSIMHYPPYAFAIPGEGPTLTALRDLPLSETIMGQHSELSKGDVAAAKYLTTGDPRTFFNAYSEVWSEYFAADAYQYGVGDVSGNGAPDLVAFGGTGGSVFVARGGPGLDGFVPGERWVTGFCGVELHCLVGDVNGDGRADVVEGETGRVAFSNGSRFVHAAGPVGGIGEFDRFFLVDVNADCRADLVAVVGGGNLPAEVYVALSTGSGFAPKLWWGDFQAGGYAVGDVDADGRADFVARRGAQILVSLSHGEGFEAAEPWWQPASWFPGGAFEVADVNGDRRADLVSLSPLSPEYAGRVAIALSTGRDFRGDVVNYHELDCLNEAGCLIADVDGDDLADLVDPVSTRRGQSHAARLAGDVFVSRSTSFVTDSIGPLKPVLGDVVFGGRCSRPSPPAQR